MRAFALLTGCCGLDLTFDHLHKHESFVAEGNNPRHRFSKAQNECNVHRFVIMLAKKPNTFSNKCRKTLVISYSLEIKHFYKRRFVIKSWPFLTPNVTDTCPREGSNGRKDASAPNFIKLSIRIRNKKNMVGPIPIFRPTLFSEVLFLPIITLWNRSAVQLPF